MRKNYDFSNALKNPYAKRLKRELEPSATTKENEDKSRVLSVVSKKRKAVKTQRPASAREQQR